MNLRLPAPPASSRLSPSAALRRLAPAVLAAALATGAARAATITLDYNGFNPGADVIVYTDAKAEVTRQAAAVAGDTAATFAFTLTTAGWYRIDLFGGACVDRTTHRIRFYFDGTDVDSVGDGLRFLSGFTANTTALTLSTIPVYIDPDGFNPPDDSPDGYIVQLEYGTSGRAPLGAFISFANGGRAGVLLNAVTQGFRYMIHYVDDRDSLGQQFIVQNGAILEEVGLVDEGVTTDAAGDEAGSTHLLVRLRPTSIGINLRGLCHDVVLGDADLSSYPMDILPANFNGTAEVLIHTDTTTGHTGYKIECESAGTRWQRISFDVNASGDIIDLNDTRATASGSSITMNTTAVAIDVTSATPYNVYAKASPTTSNTTVIKGPLTGDQQLTLLPINTAGTPDPGVYYIDGTVTDARNAFRIIYDPATKAHSLTTWSDAGGTVAVTGQQAITLLSGTKVSIVAAKTLGTAVLIR